MDARSARTLGVIGLGYIGLPTAALFAGRGGLKVVGVDVAEHIVTKVNSGTAHIAEPDLDAAVAKAVQAGQLRATTRPEPADAFIIAVPTPLVHDKAQSPTADLRYVQAAASAIAPVLRAGALVILESTVPVGTTERLAEWLAAERPDLCFAGHPKQMTPIPSVGAVQIAHCPERVLPGQMLHELVNNDRIIGGLTSVAAEQAATLYNRILDGGRCFLASNARTAELCKLSENSFRDVNIAFANELSMVCQELGGINVWELVRLSNLHPRVSILSPGPGVGGHCIAVDPWFIVQSLRGEGRGEPRLIQTAREVNEAKRDWVISQLKTLALDALARRKVVDAATGAGDNTTYTGPLTLTDMTIACLGLAYKPDVDDLRESPAVEVTAMAATWGCRILAVEPNLKTLPPKLASQGCIKLVGLSEAVTSADIVCILVAHKEFTTPSAKKAIAARGGVMDTVGLLVRGP